MLAAEYACTQPSELQSIIIADSPADKVDWVKAAVKLRSRLPKDVQEVLERCERDEKTDAEEYEKAVEVFLQKARMSSQPVAEGRRGCVDEY